MHDALTRGSLAKCARCTSQFPAEMLNIASSICRDCFSKIYLQAPPGTVSGDQADVETSWIKEVVDSAESTAVRRTANFVPSLLDNATEGRATRVDDDELVDSKASSDVFGGDMSARSSTGANGSNGHRNNNNCGGSSSISTKKRYRAGSGWSVNASDRSMRTINPIRNLIQGITVELNKNKEAIYFSVGAPTVYGNLAVSQKGIDKYCEVIRGGKANGYSLSAGIEEVREAGAKRYSTKLSALTKDDVFLTSGTSGAIELAFGALANEGENILLPRPGFPFFRTIAEGMGVECRYYSIDADRQSEVVLSDLSQLADERTRALVLNNPSNPCGSVFSREHLKEIVAVASALRIPIVGDEVYADMVFRGVEFCSVGEVSRDVPVLCLGGISKQFVVPGWRVGWVIVHDRRKILANGNVIKGLKQLTMRMLVANTPAQHVVSTLLEDGMGNVMEILESNTQLVSKQLGKVDGLRVIKALGAMYMMVELDMNVLGMKGDMEFMEDLLREEAVMVLPGQCFMARNFIRVVVAAPAEVLIEGCSRIREFCGRRATAAHALESEEDDDYQS